jgi:hypothetical protein
MERVMEQVKKDHYLAFYKHLPICDPFLGANFEGDTCALWYELRVENANKKTLDVHLFLCFSWTQIFMVQDVEWICCFTRGQKIPQA